VKRRLTALLAAAALLPATAASAVAAAAAPDHGHRLRILIVSADGRGQFAGVQAALNAIAPGDPGPTEILVRPGTYVGQIYDPADKPNVTLIGTGHDASAVVIEDGVAHGTIAANGNLYGTDCSATATVAGDGFRAYGVTFANTFDLNADPATAARGPQAVAVKAVADRVVFAHDRFVGYQDTIFASSYADPFQPQECFAEDGTPTPPATSGTGRAAPPPARQYFEDDYITGTVDFLCGSATAVFDRDTIDVAADKPGASVTAPDTPLAFTHGFLITRSRIDDSDGLYPAGSIYLGRPWRHTGVTNPVAQLTIRDTYLGALVKPAHYEDWSSPYFPWTSARFSEYEDAGPGAADTAADVPQLTKAEAADHTVAAYLNDWNPWELSQRVTWRT
jgi:pectinesterase